MREAVRVVLCGSLLAVAVAAGAQEAPAAPTPEPQAASATERGVALLRAGRAAEAKILLGKAVALDPDDAEAHASLGLLLLDREHDADRAVEHLERAVKLAPATARYHQWLGLAYMGQAGAASESGTARLVKAAGAELEKAVALAPADADGRMALLQYYLAVPASLGGSVAKAREQALSMTSADPYQGLLAQAAVAGHEEDTARQEQLYRTAIAVAPGRGDAYNQLGYLLLKEKRREEAVAAFRRYVAAEPEAANSHDSLGEGLLAAGNVDGAIAEYRKALAIDGEFSSSYLGLANCFGKKGDRAQELGALKRFLSVAPYGRQADQVRDRIQALGAGR